MYLSGFPHNNEREILWRKWISILNHSYSSESACKRNVARYEPIMHFWKINSIPWFLSNTKEYFAFIITAYSILQLSKKQKNESLFYFSDKVFYRLNILINYHIFFHIYNMIEFLGGNIKRNIVKLIILKMVQTKYHFFSKKKYFC